MTPTPPGAPRVRMSEIDMLRGLVIVLMALDHVRDYFFAGGFATNPLDPAQTTPWLYVTRWITHLCAPTFVLLTGVAAFLQISNGKTIPRVSLLLVTRGLWLVVLEATLLSFGWSFGFPYPLFLQVIWAIGWSMVALAGLVWLPRMAVLAIGAAIVAGHNLLDPINAAQFGDYALVWTFAHEGGLIMVNDAPLGVAPYAVLPWIGVIALGHGMGGVFALPQARRDALLLRLGAAMIALFLVLRGFGLYGNPSPAEESIGPYSATPGWTEHDTLGAKLMGFFDVEKYPPSLQFVLITLGLIFVLFPLLSRLRGTPARVLIVFGSVPFFFYVLHIYVVHALAIAANAAMGRDVAGMFNYMMNTFQAPELLAPLGFGLPVVYLAWIVVLTVLYPLCVSWSNLKRTRRDWWLSYL